MTLPSRVSAPVHPQAAAVWVGTAVCTLKCLQPGSRLTSPGPSPHCTCVGTRARVRPKRKGGLCGHHPGRREGALPDQAETIPILERLMPAMGEKKTPQAAEVATISTVAAQIKEMSMDEEYIRIGCISNAPPLIFYPFKIIASAPSSVSRVRCGGGLPSGTSTGAALCFIGFTAKKRVHSYTWY